MSNKLYAIAKLDDSFIVSGGTREELEHKITEIRKNHPEYYHKYIDPGFYIVKADSIKASKRGKRELSFDLPLFKTQTIQKTRSE